MTAPTHHTPPRGIKSTVARAWQSFQKRIGILQKEEIKLEQDMQALADAVEADEIKNKINSLPK